MAKEQIYFLIVSLVVLASLLFIFWLKPDEINKSKQEIPSPLETAKPAESPVKKIQPTQEVFPSQPASQTVISNIDGDVKKVSDDRLIILIQHEYFNGSQVRELEVVFGDDTVVFRKNEIVARGKDGVKLIEKGARIHVGTDENIFEKTKVGAKEINIVFSPPETLPETF